MKTGDYIRTKFGTISRIKKFFEKEDYIFLDINNNVCGKEDILKSSQNIIDLIEVGDYVNGHIVDTIDKNKEDKNKELWCGDEEGIITYCNEDIEAIVTKEQFERMEYKVNKEK